MRLTLTGLDILVIVAIAVAVVIGHNMWNVHPTKEEYVVIQQLVKQAPAQGNPKSMGGGGTRATIN